MSKNIAFNNETSSGRRRRRRHKNNRRAIYSPSTGNRAWPSAAVAWPRDLDEKKLNPDFIGIVLLLNYCYSSVSLATWKLAFFVFPIFFAAAAAAFNIFGKSFLITARNCAATCATVISLSLEGRPWFVMSGYEGSQGGQAFVFEGRERESEPPTIKIM